MKRVRSGHGILPNRNTEWLQYKGFWAYYVGLLFVLRLLFGAAFNFLALNDQYAWTALNVMHTLITFLVMHWVKGSPFWSYDDEGDNDALTFWEQIDNGMQATATRKYFTLIPIVIFLLATAASGFSPRVLFINFLILLVCIVPKLGFMHRARIAGINQD